MSFAVGVTCKAYYLSSGTRATWGAATNGIHMGAAPGALTEMTVVRNVTLNTTTSEGDGSSRASLTKLTLLALEEADIDLDMLWNTGDPVFQKLLQTKASRGTIAIALLDQDKATSGAIGYWADFVITEFTREEPIDKEV